MSEVSQEEFVPESLDNILDSAQDVVEETKTEQPESTGEKAEPEPEPEKEPEKAETESTPDEDKSDEGSETEKTVPVAALQDERRKRQELEARLEALEGNGKDEAPQEAPLPSVFEDEKGFVEGVRREIRGVELQTRLKVSHALMSEEHGTDKVNEAFGRFNELRAEYPQLTKGMAESTNPFKYVMDQVEKFDKFDKLQGTDFDAEVNRRAEEMAKGLIEDMKNEPDADVPDSLVSTPSDGVSSSTWKGPTPLEDIVDNFET